MLPTNKTKIVCTIGPASESSEVMREMLRAGMNVARLNFSHGAFSWHQSIIERLRDAARRENRRLAILADMPGPKIRIGHLREEPARLQAGASFVLTTDDIAGDAERASVNFSKLPLVVKPGDQLFLNDGNIHLEVAAVKGNDTACVVRVGGELRSRKGLNLPGIDLGISAFTEEDHACLKFALARGVDAVSQSFVAGAEDVRAVRRAAAALGRRPFIIAKVERSQALDRLDEILDVTDGVMIARGDLGVEIPIAEIAVTQKRLTSLANRLGKPVITATQMLESMVGRSRPTRAEVTDVANAILDGTDCVMLSEESAMGKFPVEAVAMLAKIAAATEPHRVGPGAWEALAAYALEADPHLSDFISRNIQHTVRHLSPTAIIVPTASGHAARMIARFKTPVWVAAVSPEEAICQGLQFSYGVIPVHESVAAKDWDAFSRHWRQAHELPDGLVVLVRGPSPEHPEANPSLEIITMVTGPDTAAQAAQA